ncbi:3'-5' exonuclease [Marinoscillum furvescens]|uniref:Predicted 3'-5' exonuclease PolB-like domain-containing protein n=1 Tax=Marinoscillum furvescens DSM 4134 TaxID=1122208 RepID=A0A3D9L7V5_MARFU|nr:3'-5' exonuclease [Marinoscillum furvescens]REE01593.1 hypothetical protein C7460_103109 [Marinoscillum furvescens DSM 4134]
MNYQLRNLLFLDIETVAHTSEYQNLHADLQKHWERKAGFFRNDEGATPEELYGQKAGIYAEFGKVITVAFGILHEDSDRQLALRIKSFSNHDEFHLLSEVKDFLETKFDPENLRMCAHNGKEFDFPYLSRRMLINGIKLPYVLDNSGKKPWEVNFLDTLEMWKFGDRKNYTSLDLLTTIFEIPSSKSDLDGSMVNEVYYHEKDGLERITAYCQRDVIATVQLFLKMKTLPIVPDDKITIVT